MIEGLHRVGVEFRSLSEDFDTSTANGRLQLSMVLAFSEWWRNSTRESTVAGRAKVRAEGRFSGRQPSLTERQREYIQVERSKGVSQRELASACRSAVGLTNRWTGRGWVELQPLHGAWPVGGLTQYQRGQRRGKALPPVDAGPRGPIRWVRPASESIWVRTGPVLEGGASDDHQADLGVGEAVPGSRQMAWVVQCSPVTVRKALAAARPESPSFKLECKQPGTPAALLNRAATA